jgi:hypothetical protein
VTLDVFTQKLGDTKMPRLDADNTGLVAVQMLDAIQTVVDVLTDNDGGKGWTVGFDPTVNAYTDRSAKRNIVVSVKPLLDAKPGDRLDRVAAIMTGFAVHEVGHTKLNFYEAISKRWPGKHLPQTLGNIIEDVVLELRTVERFPGFADHGEGNVFRPTLEWVAAQTCPKTPLKWAGSTGHKVNVTGQVIRYRDFVTFSPDAATQAAVTWISKWAEDITPALGPSGCVTLIEQLLDYMKASKEQEQPEPKPEPKGEGGDEGEPTEGGDNEGSDGDGNGDTEGDTQGVPDEDDDDTEGDDGDGGEGDGDGDGEGTTEGGEDGDEGQGSDTDTEGDGDGEGSGKGDGPGRSGDGNDADTMNRVDAPKGTNDGPGKGGSGQSISEADDKGDVDEGFDEADLDDTFDKVSKPEGYEQNRIATAEADERVTTRLDAGAHGKMRVIFR